MPIRKDPNYFIVNFRDPKDGKISSLKAKTIQDSRLGLSFVLISDLIFEESSLVANPTEEAMKKRFSTTRALHLSIYSILSIEEIGQMNKGLKFKKNKSNLIFLSPDVPLA